MQRINRIAYRLAEFSVFFLLSPVALAGVSDVYLDYAYQGQVIKPSKKMTYCLSMDAGDVSSSLTLQGMKSLCAEAASTKGYQIVTNGSNCRRLDAKLMAHKTKGEDGARYEKGAVFEFYDAGKGSSSLKVTAKLNSQDDEFLEGTIIALCRATFHAIPGDSGAVERATVTDLDDVINGQGLYGQVEFVTAGAAAIGGVYLSESQAVEVGYQKLEGQFGYFASPVHADAIRRTFVRGKIFFRRSVFIGLGIGYQTVEFDGELYARPDGTIEEGRLYRTRNSNQLHGSVSSLGLDYSLGMLVMGKTHQRGLFGGVNFGGFQPMTKVRDNLYLFGNSDENFRKKIVDKIMSTSTTFFGQLFIGVNI